MSVGGLLVLYATALQVMRRGIRSVIQSLAWIPVPDAEAERV